LGRHASSRVIRFQQFAFGIKPRWGDDHRVKRIRTETRVAALRKVSVLRLLDRDATSVQRINGRLRSIRCKRPVSPPWLGALWEPMMRAGGGSVEESAAWNPDGSPFSSHK
jgi:hypothetical protein